MDAFVYDVVRTPRGAARDRGALRQTPPIELLAGQLRALQERCRLDTSLVEDIVLGCATPTGAQGANIARIAALLAGWSPAPSGVTLNRFCASGLDALALASTKIHAGTEQIVIAGGVESLSLVPMLSDGGPWFADPLVAEATGFVPMAVAADLLASLAGIDRAACEAYALRSQRLAAEATREGRFARSLVPVVAPGGAVLLDRDECIRDGLSAEKLARLPVLHPQLDEVWARRIAAVYPSAQVRPLHTVGTSPALADAASLALLGSREAGDRLGLRPRARVVAAANACGEPVVMLTGAVAAARKALRLAGWSTDDLDLVEFNESFAATTLHFQASLGVAPERFNVNGGAIAMGHPLGATGAILLATLLDELERREQRRGLVAITAGAGIGAALLIERVAP